TVDLTQALVESLVDAALLSVIATACKPVDADDALSPAGEEAKCHAVVVAGPELEYALALDVAWGEVSVLDVVVEHRVDVGEALLQRERLMRRATGARRHAGARRPARLPVLDDRDRDDQP